MSYDKLRGRMVEEGYTQQSLAKAIHISEGQLSHKMSGHYPFKQSDIRNICECLKIVPTDIGTYFFDL